MWSMERLTPVSLDMPLRMVRRWKWRWMPSGRARIRLRKNETSPSTLSRNEPSSAIVLDVDHKHSGVSRWRRAVFTLIVILSY